MKTITATKARILLYKLIDEVKESSEPIQITGKRGNAVLISEEDWRAIQERLYLFSHSTIELINHSTNMATEMHRIFSH